MQTSSYTQLEKHNEKNIGRERTTGKLRFSPFSKITGFTRLWLSAIATGLLMFAMPASAQKYVCMQSTQGEWCLELLRDAAPGTVANFLRYVQGGLYNSSIVHRSEPGFVIQGGGFTLTSAGLGIVDSFGSIQNEFGLSNVRGTVSMAKRSGDPNSATNQWFINVGDNLNLDTPAYGSFTVFAKVVYGMEVVDKINNLRLGDLSQYFGLDFASLPVDLPPNDNTVGPENFVVITNAYTTDLLPGLTVLPYHCTAKPAIPNEALIEFCSNEVSMPVQIDGLGYEATLQVTGTAPLRFSIKPGTLQPLSALPASYATYNAATRELHIPSVRVDAVVIVDSVVLDFTNTPDAQFTLKGFQLRN